MILISFQKLLIGNQKCENADNADYNNMDRDMFPMWLPCFAGRPKIVLNITHKVVMIPDKNLGKRGNSVLDIMWYECVEFINQLSDLT